MYFEIYRYLYSRGISEARPKKGSISEDRLRDANNSEVKTTSHEGLAISRVSFIPENTLCRFI
jgi:hypothetical protein